MTFVFIGNPQGRGQKREGGRVREGLGAVSGESTKGR